VSTTASRPRATETPDASGGRLRALLREWRQVRHVSQHVLALRAGVSQRHLSFIELGRAQPSRDMVLKISEALDIPLRARNELLGAAGFASLYPEAALDGPAIARARDALQRMLDHHEPYPAVVLDRSWNIVMKNRANARLLAHCIDEPTLRRLFPDGRENFLRLIFDPHGIRSQVRSFARTAPLLLARLRREAAAYPGSPSETLLRTLMPAAPDLFVPALDDAPIAPTIPLELDVGDQTLRLFNTLTTFGTPQDVTLQELRIEMSYPADDATDALLHRWGDEPHAAG
jgi:transcriptional regulator with XRE-family HTH domain